MTTTKVSDVPMSVVGLSWSRLNEALLECDDLVLLQRWLEQAMKGSDSVNRALRIHGRLSAVRRAREVKAMRATMTAKKEANNERDGVPGA